LEENAAACRAFVEHIDSCKDCQAVDDFCPAAKPLQDAYQTARMRSRLYFGKDVAIDEATDSSSRLP
jgi:hypothetical protein